MKAILIGCVKTKAPEPRPARELYTSPLFLARREYAESTGLPWFIVSARYGLVAPDAIIEPYDATLAGLDRLGRQTWAHGVRELLEQELPPERTGTHVLELHLGAQYRRPLERQLWRYQLETPLIHTPGIMSQVNWYKNQIHTAQEAQKWQISSTD